tara:strand:- start:30 stop:755 length:726 start_codon:yes stop_codon:yes gene_type:complete
MKSLSASVAFVRKSTDNETSSADLANGIGIQDEEFIQYFNDAQYRLQSLIVQEHSDVFSREIEITCTGSAKYNIKSEIESLGDADTPPILIDNKVLVVEYTSSGSADDYYILSETTLRNRLPGSTSSPEFYIRSSGNVILVGNPSSGKIRVTYVARLKELKLSPVVLYKEASTCELPEICERYLISYVEWKILKRDSSVDSGEAEKELFALEGDIVKSYRNINDDVQTIPIINTWDDWSTY